MTQPVDTHENSLRSLCSLALSLLFWVFVRTSFLRNLKKPGTFFSDYTYYVYTSFALKLTDYPIIQYERNIIEQGRYQLLSVFIWYNSQSKCHIWYSQYSRL